MRVSRLAQRAAGPACWAATITIVATSLLTGAGGAAAAPAPTPAPAPAPTTPASAAGAVCQVTPGGAESLDALWPQQRMGLAGAWNITRGAGVVVAVVDSGVNTDQPQLARIRLSNPTNIIPGFDRTDVRDCVGHGSAVAGLIAAPAVAGVQFEGVAPAATIMPIKQTNTENDNTGTAAGLAAGIMAAVAAHASVINVSVTVTSPNDALHAAIAAAGAADIVVVAAAGNDGQQANLPAYPAAYSTEFANVLAVAATDKQDKVGQFSQSGGYVDVAAPGVAVEAPAPISGYSTVSGTSFAAPFVSGTAALVRAAYPGLSAVAVCERIEATADAPPAEVPDAHYGFGIVDPALAVTAVGAAGPPAAPAAATGSFAAPIAVTARSDGTRAAAFGIGVGLLGLTALVAVGGVLLRHSARARRAG